MDRRLRRFPSRSKEKLDFIIDIQKKVAKSHGCAFLDLRRMMGGPGAVDRWRREGLAQGDYVHLTTSGYRALGRLVGERLLEAYERFVEMRSESLENAVAAEAAGEFQPGD
jgi:hypothetical protein